MADDMRCPNGGPDHRPGVVGRKTCAACDDLEARRYEVVELGPDDVGYPDRRWAVAVDGVVPTHGRFGSKSAASRHANRMEKNRTEEKT